MTYTTRIKDEIAHLDSNVVEAIAELSAFIRFDSDIKDNEIILTIENASVARRIYTLMKKCFQIRPRMTVRIQNRFRVKQIYILTYNNASEVLEKLNIVESNATVMPDAYMLATDEEKIAFLRGLFLATGSVSNPQTSGYHMEMSVTTKEEANLIVHLLKQFNIDVVILDMNGSSMSSKSEAVLENNIIKRSNTNNS